MPDGVIPPEALTEESRAKVRAEATEITPEQWRAWGENPCTQRLLAKLEAEAAACEREAHDARERAIGELDGRVMGSLLSEHSRYQEARTEAGRQRTWARAIRKMFEPQPTGTEDTDKVEGGRRVHVKG